MCDRHDASTQVPRPRFRSMDLTLISVSCDTKQRRPYDSIGVHVPVRQCAQCRCDAYSHKYTNHLQHNIIGYRVPGSPPEWWRHCDNHDFTRSEFNHDSHADAPQYCLSGWKLQYSCQLGWLLAKCDIHRHKLCHCQFYEHFNCICHQHYHSLPKSTLMQVVPVTQFYTALSPPSTAVADVVGNVTRTIFDKSTMTTSVVYITTVSYFSTTTPTRRVVTIKEWLVILLIPQP